MPYGPSDMTQEVVLRYLINREVPLDTEHLLLLVTWWKVTDPMGWVKGGRLNCALKVVLPLSAR